MEEGCHTGIVTHGALRAEATCTLEAVGPLFESALLGWLLGRSSPSIIVAAAVD